MTNSASLQDSLSPLQGKDLVLFDLDGTLVDSVPSLALAMDRMLQQLGRPPAGEERARQWVGNGAAMLVARALSGDREVDPELDPSLKDEALELFLQAYGDCADEQATLYPGVQECLQGLQQRGLKLALVTNKPARFIEPLLQTLGLEECFELLLGGDSLSTKKPDPQPLHHCIDRLGSRPEATLMVGDSATDVQAARNAGVAVAAVSYGYSYPLPVSAAEPDWLVDCLTELL
ncbi:phosphoglycolate phosphatase [Motiliproteus coralliicola]|uniref:Phosphoglycolate phosphatase n=1 Tax=Motiliproteus coralliicola TaxID=2283196 RepID=A0A369WCV3_9GAMM|nr:phosphoglycolate phosphatase [Motiliproteus coralliicola]RDE19860.1 phosphoglycolate phosphatase [Motiliproteus coralliicola]